MNNRPDDPDKHMNDDSSVAGIRMDDVIAEYLRLCESGDRPDPLEFAERFPNHRDELLEFFTNQKAFEKIAGPIRQIQSAMVKRDDQIPEKQFGDYEIVEEIGRGGMGVIYRARQKSLQRFVALKMIHGSRLESDSDVKRFYREAEAAAALEHPNIVPIFEIGEHQGHHFFAMKLAEGGSFEQVAKAGMTLTVAVRFVIQISMAIHQAHLKGILHRDIKPSNILIDSLPGSSANLLQTRDYDSRSQAGKSNANSNEPIFKAMVTDFGLAKNENVDCDLTATDAILGTPNYMSPEQAIAGSKQQLSQATDVHGIGTVLYFAMTGVPPFRGTELIDVLNQVRDADPVRPRTLNPAVDRDLETICMKCLEKLPGRRYESALSVAEELERYLDGKPIEARPAGFVEKTIKWVRREPKLTALATVTGLLILATIGGLFAINILTGIEKSKTESALQQVTDEKATTQKALWKSYLSESRAHRWSKRPGYRFKAIESLEKAIELNRSIESTEADVKLLRDELIAALALPFDVSVAKSWRLEENNSNLFALDFDPNLKRYAAGWPDGRISIHSTASGEKTFEWAGPSDWIRVIQFSPDGNFLAVVNEKHEFFLLDIEASPPQLIWETRCELNAFDFRFDSNLLAVADPGKQIILFDLNSRKVKRKFGESGNARWLRFSPTGQKMAIADRFLVRVIDVQTNREWLNYHNRTGVSAIAFSGDGQHLATAHKTGAVRIFHVPTGVTLRTLTVRTNPINVSFIPGSDYLLVSESDGQTRAWRRGDTNPVLNVRGLVRRINGNGDYIGFRSETDVGIWNVAISNSLLSPRRELAFRHTKDVAFSSVHSICAASGNKGVELWNSSSFKKLADIHFTRTNCVAFDPRDGALITGSRLGILRWPIARNPRGDLLEIGPPVQLSRPDGFFQPHQLEFSGDGKTLAVVCDVEADKWALVYRDGSSQMFRKIKELTGQWQQFSMSDNGTYIASGTRQGENVYVWNIETGSLVKEIVANESAVATFVDGNDLMISDVGLGTRRFSYPSWTQSGQIIQHSWPQIKYSKQNDILAIATHDGGYELYRENFARKLASFSFGDIGKLKGELTVGPDGRYLAGAREEHGLQIWNIAEIYKQLQSRGIEWKGGYQSEAVESLPENVEVAVHYSPPLQPSGTTFAVDFSTDANLSRSTRLTSTTTNNSARLPSANPVFFPTGESTYAGIRFRLEPSYIAAAKNAWAGFGPQTPGIKIGRRCKKLHLLHEVMWCELKEKNVEVGRYTVHYEDNSTESISIRFGVDVNNWLDSKAVLEKNLNPVAAVARTWLGIPCHVRIKSWTNPHPDKTIAKIDLVAVHPTAAPFCLAITGEE